MDPGYPHPYHPHQRPVTAGETSAPAGDRFPQWSAQETKEFLTVRAEMDRAFMETKRNKVLWEIIATRLKEKGFSRSAEQCKSKWKNLVTRYKGSETMEQDQAMRLQQFPFYNELHAIFSARLHQMLWAEAEGSGATATAGGGAAVSSSMGRKRKGKATTSGQQMSSDEDEDVGDDSDDDGDTKGRRGGGRKTTKKKRAKSEEFGRSGGGMREVLEVFMRQQEVMEARWRESYEAREEERRRREEEWRRTMAALGEERRRMERSWREREEERRVREEARAANRDALINALLNRIRRDDHL